MTLIAPGGRRTEQPSRPPATGRTASRRSSASPSRRPRSSRSTTAAPDVRLSGSARLGAALLLVIGLLLQRTVLPLLPWGPADLVTVLVAVLGLYAGPVAGCVSGFGIGLAADALSDHALGRLAAVLCLVGYLCGMMPAAPRTPLSDRVADRRASRASSPRCSSRSPERSSATTGRRGSLLVTRCLAGLGYGLLLTPDRVSADPPAARWIAAVASAGFAGPPA